MKTRIFIDIDQLIGENFHQVAVIQETHEVEKVADLESKLRDMLESFINRVKKMNP